MGFGVTAWQRGTQPQQTVMALALGIEPVQCLFRCAQRLELGIEAQHSFVAVGVESCRCGRQLRLSNTTSDCE